MTSKTHGHSRRGRWTPTYYSWASMVQRCNNPARNNYHNYGGRGIRVCRRWLSFDLFLQDMGERPAGATIGRKDTNGHYSPANCEWQTWAKQCRTRRNNKLSLEKAETMRAAYASGSVTLRGIGALFGVSKTMARRVIAGRAWA